MILVTGGACYIGSHVCLALLEAGESLVVLDNLSNATLNNLQQVQRLTGSRIDFVNGDIRDAKTVASLFSQYSISDVIHLTGVKSVSESMTSPLSYYDNNVLGTLNLLNVMWQFNCKRFIFSSSTAAYEMPDTQAYLNKAPTTMLSVQQLEQVMSQTQADFAHLMNYPPIEVGSSSGTQQKPKAP